MIDNFAGYPEFFWFLKSLCEQKNNMLSSVLKFIEYNRLNLF
ncbi:hypothetical protein Xsto_00742 [Xenorhabdus stockiae]|uniref:Uncharacterized protein n=1 Tax=Xenorhabdus stockiae TaxID=351614 RepID=A0A2D0KUK5_9GAMM|nr:hypothetical protein Xsto_00742 [Xenorhabdus stockiae]PHM72928.1 hypothetical protein Xekj_00137 [Xenorhabdus sp. KJ12.1]